MKIYLASAANAVPELPPQLSHAQMLYRVRGSRLYRARRIRGLAALGLAVVSIAEYSGGAPSSHLLAELVNEVQSARLDGIILDLGATQRTPTPLQSALSAELTSALSPRRVFVPESLGKSATGAYVLVQTALSCGKLERHLTNAVGRYGTLSNGSVRVALECDRVRMDFALPTPAGFGTEITAERLQELWFANNAVTPPDKLCAFFSESLCVDYMFYRDGQTPHFVLYDNLETLRRKLTLAESLGITQSIMFYPHVADILPELAAYTTP